MQTDRNGRKECYCVIITVKVLAIKVGASLGLIGHRYIAWREHLIGSFKNLPHLLLNQILVKGVVARCALLGNIFKGCLHCCIHHNVTMHIC